jgi:hypothetical protein
VTCWVRLILNVDRPALLVCVEKRWDTSQLPALGSICSLGTQGPTMSPRDARDATGEEQSSW